MGGIVFYVFRPMFESIKMSKETALKWIEENKQKIIEISDKAWEYAEPGLLEFKTAELISNEIEKHGFEDLFHDLALRAHRYPEEYYP